MLLKIQPDRDDLIRLAKVAVAFLLFLALVHKGFAPPTRLITFVALGAALGLGVLYQFSGTGVSEVWTGTTLLVVWLLLTLVYFVARHVDPPVAQTQGPLIAAATKTPVNGCDGDARLAGPHLLMIFGSDGVIGRGDGPFTPLRIGTCPVLSFARRDGGLVVNSFGYDSDGNVIYRIRRNDFQMILRGFLRADRGDSSVLRIVDEQGREKLAIRYLNPDTVKVTGTLQCGDTRPVTIGDTGVVVGTTKMSGQSCHTIETGTAYGIRYASQP
jgi:hypothetical protein